MAAPASLSMDTLALEPLQASHKGHRRRTILKDTLALALQVCTIAL